MKSSEGPVAVIDLGTNTFHLVIARIHPTGTLQFLYKRRFYVKLGRDGIDRISDRAMASGWQACRFFRARMDDYQVTCCWPIGTEALRRSRNAGRMVEGIEKILGTPVCLLSGLEEAALITRGVSAHLASDHHPALIMDIGGGSVEFIHVVNKRLAWSGSYPVGVAVLHHRFHTKDPLPKDNLVQMKAYIDLQLRPLYAYTARMPPLDVIGAAGIFEILSRHLASNSDGPFRQLDPVRLSSFAAEVTGMNLNARHADPRIPRERADLLPSAMVLVEQVRTMVPVRRVLSCSDSLKEGALHAWASGDSSVPCPG